jgi:hypothetical protein
MKKIFLAMFMAGSGCVVFAQDETMNTTTNTLNTNASYNAYGTFNAIPPDYVNSYVLRDYPTATEIRWQQSPDWWHGYYVTNGQPMHIYYNTAGLTYNVALPVRQSWIPDAVVSKSVEMFGPSLYDINTVKGTNKQDLYLVRTLENGQLANHYIDESGATSIDIYRVETVDNNAAMDNSGMDNSVNTTVTETSSTDMNTQGKTKIKTKTSDGKQTKTKIKNGKVTTKEY